MPLTREAIKSRIAHREPYPVKRSNWIPDTSPPICALHNETGVWYKNKARESGGQWCCRTCGRLKSKGLRRHWKIAHTDPFLYNLKRFYTAAKHHSKKVGREFTIEFNFVVDLWHKQQGRCAITGQHMSYFPGDGERRRNKVTIDRKNSFRGYTPDNVWLVTDWANRAKSDLTDEELLLFANGIIRGLSPKS